MSSPSDIFDYESCPLSNLKRDIRLMEIEAADGRGTDEITIRLEVVELRTAMQKSVELKEARNIVEETKRKLAAAKMEAVARSREPQATQSSSMGGQVEVVEADPIQLAEKLELAELKLRDLLNAQGSSRYAALSWTWGQTKSKRFINVKIKDSRYYWVTYRFPVITNLYDALLGLRDVQREHNDIRKFWCDFICINQSPNDRHREKDYQVPMMSKIYSEAELVYVWLGKDEPVQGNIRQRDADKCSKDAIGFSEVQILDLSAYDELAHKDNLEYWKAFSRLMRRPWFSRRWVVQELALAKRAILLCGDKSVEWDRFADAVAIFESYEKDRTLSTLIQGDQNTRHIPEYFGDTDALGAVKLARATNDLFAAGSDGKRTALLTLEYLLAELTQFQASQPHDTIYALLSMAKDTRPLVEATEAYDDDSELSPKQRRLLETLSEKHKRTLALIGSKMIQKSYPVEYGQAVSNVYVRMVRFVLEQARVTHPASGLDFICRPWAPQPEINRSDDDKEYQRSIYDNPEDSKRQESTADILIKDSIPSWIRSVEGETHAKKSIGKVEKMDRKNADPLVGRSTRSTYSASGTRHAANSLHFDHGITKGSSNTLLNGTSYHSMFVEGFVLDYVKEVGDVAHNAMIPARWAKIAGCNDIDDLEALKDSPAWHAYWRTLLANRDPVGKNPTRISPRLVVHALGQRVKGEPINLKDIQYYGSCRIVSELLNRIEAVIWKKRLARSAREKFLMLLPERAAVGDRVCILYGCSVPVVLRRFEKQVQEVQEERQQHFDRESVKTVFKEAVSNFREQRRRKAEAERDTDAALKDAMDIYHAKVAPSQNSGEQDRQVLDRDLLQAAFQTAMANQQGEKKEKKKEMAKGDGYNLNEVSSERKVIGIPLQNDQNAFYEFIGECYVHSMMEGAALDIQAQWEREELERLNEESRKNGQPHACPEPPKLTSPEGDWTPSAWLQYNSCEERSGIPRTLFELR